MQTRPLRLTGAPCLRDGVLADTDLTLAEGRITDASPGAQEIDLSGYWLLPGIVDLHGDGFERHIRPRPGTPFEKTRALQLADAELASNGVTTAWFAQSWSWEGGARAPEEAVALLDARREIARRLLTDIRIQLRFETHLPEDHAALMRVVRAYHLDFLVFNNHLPEAAEIAETKPARFAGWAALNGYLPEELLAIVRAAQKAGPQVPDFLAAIAADLREAGVRMGSHDDGDAQTRAFFRGLGATICEFPTSRAAAEAACRASEPVLMGAPNIVRGGSQSGNIAAMELLEEGLVSALVSDYYVPALLQAAWVIADARVQSFAQAWEMISTRPAAIMGLADRGCLVPGQRADLVVLNPETRRIEATLVQGRIAFASGLAAKRMLQAAVPLTAAAQ